MKPGSEEYLDSEKYEVVVRDWNAPGNIKQDVSKLNRIRSDNAALHALANLEIVKTDHDSIFAYRKYAPGNELLVVVNLDPHAAHETMVDVPIGAMGIEANEAYEVTDLLTGSRYSWRGSRNYVRIDPGWQAGHLFRIRR